MLLCLAWLASTGTASALSELQNQDAPPAGAEQPQTPSATEETPPAEPTAPDQPQQEPPAEQAPAQPAPAEQPDAAQPQPAQPNGDNPDQDAQTRPDVDPNAPLPEVSYDLAKLPEPVQRMRNLLVEAAKSGDPEKLRPLLGTGDGGTQLSLTDQTEDPIKFLTSQSGDPDGQEILAILEEVLEAGYVHLDAGTPQELYVWPYFFAYPLDRLTPQQKVEIYRIVTASDFEEMQTFGSYIFYRVGIAPDGRWAFFVAGE